MQVQVSPVTVRAEKMGPFWLPGSQNLQGGGGGLPRHRGQARGSWTLISRGARGMSPKSQGKALRLVSCMSQLQGTGTQSATHPFLAQPRHPAGAPLGTWGTRPSGNWWLTLAHSRCLIPEPGSVSLSAHGCSPFQGAVDHGRPDQGSRGHTLLLSTTHRKVAGPAHGWQAGQARVQGSKKEEPTALRPMVKEKKRSRCLSLVSL